MTAALMSALSSRLMGIENDLTVINNNIDALHSNVGAIDQNVKIVSSDLEKLTNEFRDFVQFQIKAGRKQVAHTELVRIRQELEKKYGHYDIVRRTTTGILQADDLTIVRKDTISTATEEIMISTPGYWLAPCLVALSAWINDQPELAERALREGIRRNDEKTSLFFALICRRSDRKEASLKWTQRYLANQDEENLDRKAVIILDAFVSGLLGADTEGVVSKQIGEWMDRLSSKVGFIEKQTTQWADAILLKREPLDSNDYPYLKKYSKTWPILEDIMEGAHLHAAIYDYFHDIFEQEFSTDSLKEQLDAILASLVTDFDDEELPLRKEEKFNQFIIDFDGDEQRARQNMTIEQTAFETHKDFTQLLTDAAMKPESAHASASTQKFAIAMSKDWILDGYNDVIAQNRMKVPHEIEINIDTFNDKTTEGDNEEELIERFDQLVTQEKTNALSQYVMTSFDQFCLYGGFIIGLLGLGICFTFNPMFGGIAIVIGIVLVLKHFSTKKAIANARATVEAQYEQKREEGKKLIRATCAEVVDFRHEFAQKDQESQKVIDFLEQIVPEQYIRKLSGSTRRINVN